MRLLIFEFQKIIYKKSIIISLIAICLSSICFFVYDQHLNPSFSNQAYKLLQKQLDTIPNQERYDYIKTEYEKFRAFEAIETIQVLKVNEEDNQYLIDELLSENPEIDSTYQRLYQESHNPIYTDSLEDEVVFLESIYQEFDVLHQYPDYLQGIQEKAKEIVSISIFNQGDDFSSKNIKKTADDYQHLSNIDLIYESEKGIYDATTFSMTNFFLLIAMFVISSSIIYEEKEKNLFKIIKITKNGQWKIIVSKCIVMILMTGMVVFVMQGLQLLYMKYIIGLGNLSKPIQSLAYFNKCSLKINVLEFLLLFFFMKWISASIIGLFMITFMILFHHLIFSIVTTVSLISIEWLLYVYIGALHPMYLLKYLNLISFLQTDNIFIVYRNIDFFSHPVSLQWVMVIVVLIVAVISFSASVFSYYYKKDMSVSNLELTCWIKHQKPSLSLFNQELYKTFWIQKVIFLILICIGLQIYQYKDTSIYLSQDYSIYLAYMKKLEGPLTNEKEQFILEEKNRFETIHEKQESIKKQEIDNRISKEQSQLLQEQLDQQCIGEEVFNQIVEQYEKIKHNPNREFVIPFFYQYTFLNSTWTMLPCIIMCLFSLIASIQIFPYEYKNQVNRITLLTTNGKQSIIRNKIMISFILCVLFLIITVAPVIILFALKFPVSMPFAPALSLNELSLIPKWIPLIGVYIITILIQLFGIFSMTVTIHMIATKIKNMMLTCFISIIIFVIPLLLAYGNIHILDNISLYPLLMSGMYLADISNVHQLLFSISIYLVVALSSVYYIKKNYTLN